MGNISEELFLKTGEKPRKDDVYRILESKSIPELLEEFGKFPPLSYLDTEVLEEYGDGESYSDEEITLFFKAICEYTYSMRNGIDYKFPANMNSYAKRAIKAAINLLNREWRIYYSVLYMNIQKGKRGGKPSKNKNKESDSDEESHGLATESHGLATESHGLATESHGIATANKHKQKPKPKIKTQTKSEPQPEPQPEPVITTITDTTSRELNEHLKNIACERDEYIEKCIAKLGIEGVKREIKNAIYASNVTGNTARQEFYYRLQMALNAQR